jgi:predicted Zn-dependent protease
MRKSISKFIYLLIAAVALNTACVSLQTSPVSGNKRVYGYSWEKELEIGEQADGEIIAQYGLYDNDQVAEYVSSIGQELLEVSHFSRDDTPDQYKNTDFTFRVLDSPVVNAFALPGGYVYVTRGLMTHLENEAQLAVVLGHEIGHVAARHASQRAAEQQIGQLAVIGGAVLGQSIGLDGGNILQLSSQTAQLLFLSYSRDDERESDRLGVEYAAMDGYKAAEGAEFFTSLKRISEKAGQSIPSHLSSHPDPGEREKNIPEMAEGWAEKGYDMTIVDKEEYLAMIDGMVYGENPRNGFERDGVFYHPDMEFEFPVPDQFTLVNQPNAVILFNEAQDAIVQFSIDSENSSPQASVQAFLSQDGITTVEQETINVNGYEGYTAQATAQTQDGTSLTVELSAVEFQGSIYQFLSYTTTVQFDDYSSAFSSVVNGFQQVEEQSILNIQPVRLQLIEASGTAPFSELLPESLPMDIQPLDIAILNQVGLDDTIQQGTLLKIPVQ